MDGSSEVQGQTLGGGLAIKPQMLENQHIDLKRVLIIMLIQTFILGYARRVSAYYNLSAINLYNSLDWAFSWLKDGIARSPRLSQNEDQSLPPQLEVLRCRYLVPFRN